MMQLRQFVAAILLAGGLAGCATTGDNPRDPLEPMNRGIFEFNEGFDKVLLKPVSEGYRAVLPGMVRTGVTNFFSNIEDLWIAVNNLLQGKVENGLKDVMRVGINTVFGLLGVIDVASDAGLDKHNEDFGQTLGRWGFNSGPYIVLPFLGPSSMRDGAGRILDWKADPVVHINNIPARNETFAVRAVNDRADLLDASKVMEEAALDKYSFVRDSYLQRRRSLIYDGNPPKDEGAAAPAQDKLGGTATESPDAHTRIDDADLPPSLAITAQSAVVSASGGTVLLGTPAGTLKISN